MHNIVRILLKEPSEETTRKAWNIIHDLEGEIKNPLAVSLLKLELLAVDQAATQDYHEALVQVVRQVHLSDMNVRTVLHHVHELRRRSARLAHSVLVELLTERLLAMDETAWVEKTLVTLIWNCTAPTDLVDAMDTLEELLDTIAVRSVSAIGTSATHAAQIEYTLLYACVLEAQKNGDRQQVIRALSRVREKNGVAPAPGLHLPALLRLTARMLTQELEGQQSQDTASINELCKVFEGGKMQPKPSKQVVDLAFPAASAAKTSRRDPSSYNAFPVAELDWFSCNIYNIALKMCTLWKAETTLRLVQACLKLQYYLELRKTMSDFRSLVNEQLSKLEGGAKSDLLRKYACLVAFDFEAAARLKSWRSFEELINVRGRDQKTDGLRLILDQESEICEDPKVYNVMADIVLSCEAPTEGKHQTCSS
ncbi:MAG: hypothetical protein Q9181_001040 [Wetmoreana brouardii]